MIKVNVEVNNKPWYKKIKNPKRYFNKKLKKIPRIIPFFKRKNATFTIFLTNSLGIKKLNKKIKAFKQDKEQKNFYLCFIDIKGAYDFPWCQA